jgi:hypothetical protein
MRWNDDRLDDLAHRVDQLAEATTRLSDMRTEMVELRGDVKNTSDGSGEGTQV